MTSLQNQSNHYVQVGSNSHTHSGRSGFECKIYFHITLKNTITKIVRKIERYLQYLVLSEIDMRSNKILSQNRLNSINLIFDFLAASFPATLMTQGIDSDSDIDDHIPLKRILQKKRIISDDEDSS